MPPPVSKPAAAHRVACNAQERNVHLHPESAPIAVVMGVAGSGKTTVGRALAQRLGWHFQEGDELHPPGNVAKMRRVLKEALTSSEAGPKVIVASSECMLNKQRRAKPEGGHQHVPQDLHHGIGRHE